MTYFIVYFEKVMALAKPMYGFMCEAYRAEPNIGVHIALGTRDMINAAVV